ncbi:MAG: Cof-type HAD-IIB family hydrolase [Gordonia sp. (in: high G+C Gram-positive bacteria)]|uniref:Cof-type HAD-IIB family hydrolase n=1 Tax=Gordonia sp. (in: high G+C Gram-positive bacteria) TaxID=84139 RepID=UPI003BB6408F
MADLPIPELPDDVRMVVADMDGTLLTPQGDVPDGFWPLLDRMRERGITFVPASGRQYYTLEALFARSPEGISYIAENGNLVVHDGQFHPGKLLDAGLADEVVLASREAAHHRDLGLVVCGVQGGYAERTDPTFIDEFSKYYHRLTTLDDLLTVDDDILKVAIFDADGAADSARDVYSAFADRCQVVVSGPKWIDLMAPGIDKGVGLRMLQDDLNITPAQTVVFGDYLNDLQMLDGADWSFAMADAHPDVLNRARYQAPANADQGVVAVLAALLGDG